MTTAMLMLLITVGMDASRLQGAGPDRIHRFADVDGLVIQGGVGGGNGGHDRGPDDRKMA